MHIAGDGGSGRESSGEGKGRILHIAGYLDKKMSGVVYRLSDEEIE
jgi:hypothetical protein